MSVPAGALLAKLSLGALSVALLAALAGCSGGSATTADGAAGQPSVTSTGGATAGQGGGGQAAGGSHAPGGAPGQGAGGQGGVASGAAGAGGAAQSCLGPCLDAFLSNCSEVGQTCVSATVGQQTTACYANGVKDQTSPLDAGEMGVVKDASGKVCRTRTVSASGEDLNGPDGALVAHVAYGAGQAFTVTCHAPDGTVQVTTGSFDAPACAAVVQQAQQACVMGDCVW